MQAFSPTEEKLHFSALIDARRLVPVLFSVRQRVFCLGIGWRVSKAAVTSYCFLVAVNV